MSDEFKKFPTRVGTAVGSSIERTMQEEVGDTASFRTRILSLPDGEVRMRTRGGAVDFVRTDVPPDTGDCFRGPFVEKANPEVEYKSREYYDNAVVWTWGDFVSMPVVALKYLVVENPSKKKLALTFRWKDEPEANDVPASEARFDETDFSKREYHDRQTDKVVTGTLSSYVTGRFKGVLAPIKKIKCNYGKYLEFAAPDTIGTNPTSQGCVRNVLAEWYAETRLFVGDWIKKIFPTTGTGVADITVLDDSGFLTPVETGDGLACMDIPAIGTRVIGVRVDSVAHMYYEDDRAIRTYENAVTPWVFYLESRETHGEDQFGNVAGLIWRPSPNHPVNGPDIAVSPAATPFPSAFLRVNSDDTVWRVVASSTSDSEFTFSVSQITEDTVEQEIVVSTGWGAAHSAVTYREDTLIRRVFDVSKHGDKILIGWIGQDIVGVSAYTAGAYLVWEVTFTGDFPSASATGRWVLIGETHLPPGVEVPTSPICSVRGVYIDATTDETRWIVSAVKETARYWHAVTSGGGTHNEYHVFTVAFGSCSVGDTTVPNMGTYLPAWTFSRSDFFTAWAYYPDTGAVTYSWPGTYSSTTVDDDGKSSSASGDSTRYEGGVVGTADVTTTQWGRVSQPEAAVVFPKAFLVKGHDGAVDGGAILYPIVSGVLDTACATIDATRRKNGCFAYTDTRAVNILRNPVTGETTVVGFEVAAPFYYHHRYNFV